VRDAILAAVTLAAAMAGIDAAMPPPARVLVIAHRGASGYRPEHTLEAYRLAIEMGADAIEPDLVSTRDGVLVARHEPEIGGTTDVADKFPDRRRTEIIEGQATTGWFTTDLTLAELKTLRARERLPFRSHEYDGRFEVPTFEDVLDLAEREARARGRTIAVYPETKHPSYFRERGVPLEPRLLAALAKRGLTRRDSPVFVQSFDPASLQELRPRTDVRLVQLIEKTVPSSEDLARMATYAQGIGADKRLILPLDAETDALRPPTDLVTRAHAAGLFVHAWTMRSDARFLAKEYAGDAAREYAQLASLGVDGVFSDFPDHAIAALR
jgi:glycerophosphoryl diester phosphodiesterase